MTVPSGTLVYTLVGWVLQIVAKLHLSRRKRVGIWWPFLWLRVDNVVGIVWSTDMLDIDVVGIILLWKESFVVYI